MKRRLLPSFVLACLACLLPCLRGEAPSITLPPGDPLLVLSVPSNGNENVLSTAVSKALAGEKWSNLGWLGSITTGKSTYRRVSIDVFAVTSATQVKIYATFTDDAELTPERRQELALDRLELLEKRIARELKLKFYKGRGENGADLAG